MKALRTAILAIVPCLAANTASAQMTVVVRDISPDQSTLDAANPNGASGGRVNGLGVDRTTPARVYAASEWGGLFRSTDSGLTWAHLDGHVPTATWDVEVDPTNSNRVYATSFYDGRVNSRSGINVSTDGGATWTHPATATPPANFCLQRPDGEPSRRRSASRSIPPMPIACSSAPTAAWRISTDAGVTWNFVDPTPANRRHKPSGTSSSTTAASSTSAVTTGIADRPMAARPGRRRPGRRCSRCRPARCSLTVSPDEAYVLFAVVGTSIFETDNGGQSWQNNYPNPSPQGAHSVRRDQSARGRHLRSVVRRRQPAPRDLHHAEPRHPGGAQRCNASAAWATRDRRRPQRLGDIAFAPGVANDACPILFSSDGGVYRNINGGESRPATRRQWEQPNVTPHALWNYAFTGVAHDPARSPRTCTSATRTPARSGPPTPARAAVTWTNERCCDGFDAAGEADPRADHGVLLQAGGRATRMFHQRSRA